MSQFLRDAALKNLKLTEEERLQKINELIFEIAKEINQNLTDAAGDKKYLLPSYIIRFDDKGFKLYEFEKVIKYFKEANKVERIIFILESLESIQSNRLSGKSLELWLDVLNPDKCNLTVQANEGDWVDATFCRMKELLDKYKSKNFLVRNSWTPFVVQMLGVVMSFVFSLWGAIVISPKLTIENAFTISFIMAFLIFSNAWTYFYPRILSIIDYYWPNVSFKERKGIHWLLKGLLITLLASFSLFVVSKVFSYLEEIFKPVLK